MKNENPTIIILTPGFPADEADSTCLPLLQTFLKKLKENFARLNIIVLSFQYPFFKQTYRWNGIEVISFNGRNRKRFYRLLLWLKIKNRLKEIHYKNNIIGILSIWYGECAWIGNKFSKKNNLKHFCWLWGQDARKGNRYVKWSRPSANELIALSDFLQMEFEKNYSIRPSHVIPPGIDVRHFNDRTIERDMDVLGAGSLIPLKQYDIFIKTISNLKKHFPDIRVIICGKGPEEFKLQQEIETLQLKKNIILPGELHHKEVLQLMQRSKILLHTSSYEGFGLVCAEALNAGCHVISFCKPMNEKIKHWHVVNNTDEMTETAIEVLRSETTSFEPVPAFDINKTVISLMSLFDYKEEMTS